MANIKSAKKRIGVIEKKTAINRRVKNSLKGIVKGFDVSSFGSALLFSLVLTAVNYLLELPNKYLGRKELHKHKDDNTDDEGFTPYEEIKD